MNNSSTNFSFSKGGTESGTTLPLDWNDTSYIWSVRYTDYQSPYLVDENLGLKWCTIDLLDPLNKS